MFLKFQQSWNIHHETQRWKGYLTWMLHHMILSLEKHKCFRWLGKRKLSWWLQCYTVIHREPEMERYLPTFKHHFGVTARTHMLPDRKCQAVFGFDNDLLLLKESMHKTLTKVIISWSVDHQTDPKNFLYSSPISKFHKLLMLLIMFPKTPQKNNMYHILYHIFNMKLYTSTYMYM